VAREVLFEVAPPMGRFSRVFVRISVGGALALAAGPAWAEGSEMATVPPVEAAQPSRTLSLPEAVAFASTHQPAIRAALSRVAERMAESKVPSGQWLPTVGATAQLFGMTANNTTATFVAPSFMDMPRIGATASTTTSSANLAPYPSTFVGASISQEIFDFGRIGAQRAAADDLVQVEKHSADAVLLDLDLRVGEAYFAVLAAKAIVRASDEAYDRSRVHRDLAKRGVDSGLRSPIELTRAEADLMRFDVGRVRARGGLAVAQSVLAGAIGATDTAIDAGETPQPRDMPSLADALQMARSRDPMMARALADLKAAEDQTTALGALLRPNLLVTGTISGRAGGAPSTTANATPDGGGWIPAVPNWDVGAVLSWPIFDGTVAARRDAAQSLEQVRRDEVDAQRLQEVVAVRDTFVQVQVARSALAALENTVLAARANYDQADARFRSGIGNAVELADAEAVRTDADIQLALGQFELARARALFGRAVAEGL
jgi:outer membrane protein TolC